MRILFIIKKFQKYFVLFIGSLVLVVAISSVYFALRSPLREAINGTNQKINFEYTIIQEEENVLGATSTSIHKTAYAEINTLDNRAWVFDQYLEQNNSPLSGHGVDFVNACNKYNTPTDCTLLIAIAKIETNLCKTDLSAQQYNCWGYGGSGSNRIHYSSFEEAIDSITGRLMNGYRTRFFEDPEAGELFYCGAHCDTWGDKVKDVQNQLKAFAKESGYPL